ncbi:acyloxyacyl hydrolase [Bernardetia sp. ABR2-2B]|uniref:acyloxyacyl hydrolase n=1 Tax=Bernardetia sp. ABR2-2B TaxID=3127472 RepID=UPI0030CAEF5D
MKTILLTFVLICLSCHLLYSQTDSYFIGAKTHYGYIIPHSEELNKFSKKNPFGIQIEFSTLKTSDEAWQTCTCYGRSGLSLAYFNYRDKRLGSSTNLMYFVEPYLAWKHKFKLSLRAAIGVSYLTQVYDSINNSENTFFSSPISFYLGVGLNGNYHLNKNYALNIGINYQHISNGGIRKPNLGMNFPTLSLGIDRTIDFPTLEKKPKEFFEYDKKVKTYLLLNGSRATAKNENGKDINYPILGLSTGLLKPLSKINGVNTGIEIHYNFAYRQELQNQDNKQSAFVGGLQIGHHFSLGKIYFLQQIGIYTFRPKAIQTKWLYQRYSLWYSISQKWFVGFSLLSHGHIADYIDVSTGFIF